MEKDNNNSDYAAHLLEVLTEDNMSVIDFDQLKEWLAGVAGEMEKRETYKDQLKMLAIDYVQRIGVMIKAMAALDRKRDSWPEALAQVEALESMSASELVACYRQTAARFRDCFPTSFGLLRETRQAAGRLGDLNAYK